MGISKSNTIAEPGLRDTQIQGNDPFLQDATAAVIHVESLGGTLHAFINKKLAGSAARSSDKCALTLETPATLIPGRGKAYNRSLEFNC
ncbi:hypothetical protein FRX31_009050 [Thalictrum thalictroides]|uniref:Uncharacterized protein n=1 Tax=Thalictrum thalictroides TaxID=46969 RepID=A0A7J6WVC8_THATH|nr:hypothetical protein FRX31_009050 [Thalictrum thalictroides]